MEIGFLPLAEVHIKEEDETIEFDDNDDKDLTSFDSESYDHTIRHGLGFIKEEPVDYEEINDHFLFAETGVPSPNDSKRLQCNECGKQFNRKEHLENHRRTHTGERPFVCTLCGKTFIKPYDLSRHKQYTHDTIMTFFICEECGKTFSRKDHLKSHQLTHKRQIVSEEIASLMETYVCDTCGRAYSRLDNFKKHVQKHFEGKNRVGQIGSSEKETGTMFDGVNFHISSASEVAATENSSLRPHSCKHCGRLFLRKDHLRNHERTHTGERPFQCSECDRRFAKRFVMTRHLQNVHGVNAKFHECTECDRKFARSDHLKTHMKIHILAAVRNQRKEKAFKCEVCDSSFTRSDNLKTHMKIHLFDVIRKSQKENQDNRLKKGKRLKGLTKDEKECQETTG